MMDIAQVFTTIKTTFKSKIKSLLQKNLKNYSNLFMCLLPANSYLGF